MERRLAAIMAADVVGYSRLIRADEEGTLAALKALRADLIDPKLMEHNGRIVKLMGDGMLAEFPSGTSAYTPTSDILWPMSVNRLWLPATVRDPWTDWRNSALPGRSRRPDARGYRGWRC